MSDVFEFTPNEITEELSYELIRILVKHYPNIIIDFKKKPKWKL